MMPIPSSRLIIICLPLKQAGSTGIKKYRPGNICRVDNIFNTLYSLGDDLNVIMSATGTIIITLHL